MKNLYSVHTTTLRHIRKALLCITLILCMGFTQQAFAGSGIYDGFAIMNVSGGGNTFYDLVTATGNPDFQGTNFGAFTYSTGSLLLKGAQLKTYKNGSDNICGGKIYYSVYPSTGSPTTWNSISLPFSCEFPTAGCGSNPGDQVWETSASSVNLISGLAPGNYKVAVYVTDNGDAAGGCSLDPFHTNNNSGAYWIASFNITATVYVTATGGVPAANYTTLAAAFSAISIGTHTGAINVRIWGNTSEGSSTATLGASGTGGASYTSISIQPDGGAARTISGATTAGNPMIDFNGADNVTVDGLNTGGNTLTFSNTTVSATSGTSTIRFQTDATSNTITRCSVLGSATMATGTNGGNIWFGSAAVSTGNDNNTISFCDIGPAGANLPSKCIYFSGSSNTDPGTANSGIIINSNNIFDYFNATVSTAGIDLNSGSVGTTISNNKFYQTASRTMTTSSLTHSAIRISNTSGNAYQITGNTIGFASSAGTGTYTIVTTATSPIILINLSVGTTTATSVQGNTIAGIAISGATSGTSSSAAFRGIYVGSGLTTIGDVTGNTIGSMSITGSITYTSSSSSNSDVIGIFNFGSSNWTTNNNNIGGITASNSSTGASNIYGLRCNTGSGVTWTCNSNTIGGTVANSINANGTSTSTAVNGIKNDNPIGTFTSNIIRNMTAAGGTGTTSAASMIGIAITSTANQTISQNTIFNLSNSNTTAATVVTGIQFTGSTANTVARNNIYALTSSTNSTTAEINGIRVAGGTTTYKNNMIALGAGVANAIGSAASNSGVSGINGINEALGTNNFWHNNIYIGGSPTAGTGASYAFNGTQTINTRSFRDNIFVNARSNSGATGKNYAVKINGTAANPTGLTINNNIYSASGTGGVFGFFNSLDVANLAAWKIAVGQDAASFESNPQYNDPTNATPDLHIHPTNPTQAEGNGFDLGVTDDYDGQTRASFTPVDIGADAGNFVTAGDVNAPVITYTALSGTCLTTDRTLTATITDASGVPTSGVLMPRIYFKKNSGSYVSAAGSLTSGTGTSGTWDFVISSTALGGVTGGDLISYYVIAQDIAGTPNISSNPSGVVATNVNTITTPPTPNTYSIGLTSGTFTVGIGGNFTTLTAAVSAYNAACISGPIVFNLIDATYPSETFPITINAVSGTSATNTLTIKPATTATISGSSASSIIKINGGDYITIDGSNAGGTDRSLTITNTNTAAATAAIWVASTGAGAGATNNVVKNLNLSCGADQSTGTNATFGIISNGAVSVTNTSPQQDNDNNTYRNNAITSVRYGIFSIGESAANPNQNTNISSNLIGPAAFGATQIGKGGIVIANENAATITLNEVRFVGVTAGQSASGTDRAGISLATDASWTPTTTAITNSSITRNNIHDIVEEKTFSAAGIVVASSASPSNNIIANNMIYNVRADGTSPDQGVGIGIAGGNGDKVVYNTISMTGDIDPGAAATADQSEAGIRISSTTPTNLTLANNIISVDVTSNTATLKHYAIVAPASYVFGTGFSNNNDLYVNASNAQMVLGGTGTSVPYTAKTTLAAWQTSFTPSQDLLSKTNQPIFISSTDLHLNTTSNNNLDAAATPIAGVTNDYDNDTRNATTPDIGADEFSAPLISDIGVFGLVTPVTGSGCYTATESFSVTIKNYGTVPWDFSAFNATITASVSGAGVASFPLTINNNSYNGGSPLASGASMTVALGTLDMRDPGTYTFNASIAGTGDAVPANDAMTATNRIGNNPVANLVSNSPVCEGSPINLTATSTGGNNTITTTFSGSKTETPALAVPDNSLTGAASTITIAGSGTISAANGITVGLNISTTFNGDVDAYLVGPSGCGSIELTTDNGSSSDGMNITLYNSGAFPSVTTMATTDLLLITGNYLMEGTSATVPATLSGTGNANYPGVVYTALNGCNINGTWTLFVGDDVTGDVPSINSWSLAISGTATGNYSDNFSGTGTFGSVVYSGASNSQGDVSVTAVADGAYMYSVTTTDANACPSKPATTNVTVNNALNYYTDADTDGYGDALASPVSSCSAIAGSVTNNTDCNDGNASVNPGATEVCNFVDDDCDGTVDDGITYLSYYNDADGDGYGAGTAGSYCTDPGAGFSLTGDDCNDLAFGINPGATEICNGIDDDCAGGIDNGLIFLDYYVDADGDSYGDASASPVNSCSPIVGSVTNNTDCNDGDAAINPGATEICNFIDDDCDGTVDEGITYLMYYNDADGDGYGAGVASSYCTDPGAGFSLTGDDCNDLAFGINPGATEVCNGIDDNCAGGIDEGVLITFYADADADTYGDAAVTTMACSAPSGYVANDDDCDDTNSAINPSAAEICDGIDNNCNGLIDNADPFITGQPTWYADADVDSYGDAGSTILSCTAPFGYVANNTDCNDGNSSINPGATEICNFIDDDCDGTVDDGITYLVYYADADGDLYGAGLGANYCTDPGAGYSLNNTDCNDGDASVNPGATEICNAIDDDCDGTADDGLIFLDYYVDADGDGYGDALASPVNSCSAIAGSVTNNTDCNDGNSSINPGATEICNFIDDDCDGSVDDGITYLVYYADADGDLYGAGLGANYCTDPGAGYSLNNTDCNDGAASINPGATEICNAIDDDCDGTADDGLLFTTYYFDGDADTYGDAFNTISTCDGMPSGYVTDATDCDDTQNTVYPGAPEICDGFDNDCDGDYDEGTVTATISPVGPVATCKGVNTTLNANGGVGYTYQWFKNGNLIAGATSSSFSTSKPGNYQVQVTIPAGCFAVSSATIVTVNPNPNANISAPNGTSLCTTVKLKASYDASYTWQWNKGGVPIIGANSYQYLATTPGSYTCTITNSFGCTRTTASLSVTACKEAADIVETEMNIYPNPTDKTFSIDLTTSAVENSEATIQIFNIVGEEVYNMTSNVFNNKLSESIELSESIPGGVYFVKVVVGNNEFTRQLILQK